MEKEDSEKRFHTLMDKLFSSPKPPNQSLLRNKKRGNSVLSDSNDLRGEIVVVSGLNRCLVPALSEGGPMCRPWDRGDLMRRLATFKSMSWFGKPKVVSAVNCARRGWVNVEMDIIACESCGARLLFSTPSSWPQQQIEKAAAVFSLKLDNGHKFLCPWIDNACDESLALFPPTPAPALIDGYKERCSALLQLSALPVVSSSAIDHMRCPQLEHFLEQPPLGIAVGSIGTSRTEYLDRENPDSANLYYQAQKLISLCRWEPRSLQYAVDCKDFSSQQNDNSVVLDCKLCGASVGLWAFSTVPRPLEWFRIVESLEINGQAESTNSGANVASRVAGTPVTIDCREENCVGHNSGTMGTATSTRERSLTLNSIAGGPSPAKQNYKATVSLPILSRHLRAGLSSRFDDRCNVMPSVSSLDHETAECNSASHTSLHRENDQLCNIIVQPEDVVITPEKDDVRLGMSKGNSHSCLEEGDHVRHVMNDCTYSEKDDGTAPDANGTVKNQMQSSNNSFRMSTDDISTHQLDESVSQAGQESVSVSSSPEVNLTLNMACGTNLEKDNKGSDHQKSLNLEGTDEEVDGLKDTVHSSVNNELIAVNDLKWAQSGQGMEFDPIRQHRHFCPWIMSTAKTGPGWKLTLSALDCEMTSSRPSLPDSPSSSMLEADDPITSVRNLFKSPSTKRIKTTHNSSVFSGSKFQLLLPMCLRRKFHVNATISLVLANSSLNLLGCLKIIPLISRTRYGLIMC